MHDGVGLLVVHRLACILQHEVYGVALFAGFKVCPFVDVEQFDMLQLVLFCRVGCFFYLLECDGLVDEQSQIATDGRILADFLEMY